MSVLFWFLNNADPSGLATKTEPFTVDIAQNWEITTDIAQDYELEVEC